jgi:hypothetical protein
MRGTDICVPDSSKLHPGTLAILRWDCSGNLQQPSHDSKRPTDTGDLTSVQLLCKHAGCYIKSNRYRPSALRNGADVGFTLCPQLPPTFLRAQP